MSPCEASGSEKPPTCSRAHCCLSAPNPATNGDAGRCENIKIGEAPLLEPCRPTETGQEGHQVPGQPS